MTAGAEGGEQLVEVSLWTVAARLLRDARSILLLGSAAGALALLGAVLRPRTFTNEVVLQPAASAASLTQLTTLAAQFGVRVPGGESGDSPELYKALLLSRPVLEGVASGTFSVQGETRDLSHWAYVDEPDETLRRDLVVEWIAKKVAAASVDKETGLVRLVVRTTDPELTKQVAEAFLQQLDLFNQKTRQSRASSERKFIEERLASAKQELIGVEAAMRGFINSNRRFTDSPDLRFEHDRLQREVSLKQQIVVSLSEALQEARIAEVRDTPVLTVLEPPHLPSRSDRRHLVAWLLGGFGAGVVAALVVVLVKGARPPADAPARQDYEEVLAALRRVSRDRADPVRKST